MDWIQQLIKMLANRKLELLDALISLHVGTVQPNGVVSLPIEKHLGLQRSMSDSRDARKVSRKTTSRCAGTCAPRLCRTRLRNAGSSQGRTPSGLDARLRLQKITAARVGQFHLLDWPTGGSRPLYSRQLFVRMRDIPSGRNGE
jgi:hypothetical protein